MESTGPVIATLGALLLLGLLGDLLARRLRIPRVSLLILFGLGVGPSGFSLLPGQADDWYPLISNLALLIVGFLLGGKLTLGAMRSVGRQVVAVSLLAAAAPLVTVCAGLLAAGVQWEVALLLAGIAPATAPAAVANIAEETGAKGRFTDTLLGVVAIDDAWGLILFSFVLAAVQTAAGAATAQPALMLALREVGGALLLGVLLGVPAAYVTGRLRPGEPTRAEALGVVLLAGGIAIWAEVSFLLTAMVVGAVIANLARHHERAFHEIEGIEWPFMVLFFILAGASLELGTLTTVGWIVLVYAALRALGKILGGYAGGAISGAPPRLRRWIGLALLPQAGVALGMALLAGNAFPALRDTILPLVIASTVVFELAGPFFTRLALERVGESDGAGEG